MRILSSILAAAALTVAVSVLPQAKSQAQAAGGGSSDSLIEESTDQEDMPVTGLTVTEHARKVRVPPRLTEGTNIIDLPVQLTLDPTGKWYTITEPRVGTMKVMPSELLDVTLQRMREEPDGTVRVSGEAYLYKGSYYLKLAKTDFAPVARRSPATALAAVTARPQDQATSQPVTRRAHSSEDLAVALLSESPAKPILPYRNTEPPKSASVGVTPTRQPLKAGPDRTVANRVVRLQGPDAEGWYEIAFESDNTLQDPPLRVQPCQMLEKMHRLIKAAGLNGQAFVVSGEVTQFGPHAYILLREVRIKRNMNEF